MFTGRLAGYCVGTVVVLIYIATKIETTTAREMVSSMAPKKAPTKDVSIAARITVSQAQRLDEVQALEPALSNRSATIGRLIDMVTDEDLEVLHDAAEGKELVLSADVVATILEALADRTRAYNTVAKQVRAIGNNLNQLVRLGNQMSIYGKQGEITLEAIEGLSRQHEDIVANELHQLAAQDAHVETVVRACRPR